MKSILIQKNNKKGGVTSDIVNGTGNLIITIVIILVIVSTLLGANLLTSGSAEATSANNLGANLSAGVDNISTKIPTLLLVAIVVVLIGVLLILVRQTRGATGGGSTL